MIYFARGGIPLRDDLCSMLILVSGIVLGQTYDCTCTTSTLGAAQFRSGKTNASQIFEKSGLRIRVVQLHLRAVQIKPDSILII